MVFGLSKNTIMSAAANFSTAYNLTIISLALVVAEGQYSASTSQQASLKSSVLAGAVLGQLCMGSYADLAGRSAAMSLTMALTIMGGLLSSMQLQDIWGHQTEDPYAWITFCRFLLGVGVGGVYPLAATVAAESSTDNSKRGMEVSAVFSTQGLGFIACPIIMLIIIGANPDHGTAHWNAKNWSPANAKTFYGNLYEQVPNKDVPTTTSPGGCKHPYCSSGKKAPCDFTKWKERIADIWDDKYRSPKCKQVEDCFKYSTGCNDINWRIALALGALPGILMLPFKVSETKRGGEALAKSTFWTDISKSEHWPTLMGTAGGWFLFDITFYGNSLFAPTVTKIVFNEPQATIHDTCAHNAALFAVALPGYWIATYLMESLGRKNIQLLGFSMMAILYAILGGLLIGEGSKKVGAAGMFILYSLTFFFSNFGPNSTTFILPSESFPPDVRASLNGFSAASGKIGAYLGATLFKPLADELMGGGDKGIGGVLLICGGISLLGVIITFIFVEDRRGKAMKGDDEAKHRENLNDPLLDA